MKLIQRITRITVLPEGDPIFCDQATHFEIEDEAAGEFVKITQPDNDDDPVYKGSVTIDATQWPIFRNVIESLLADCQDPYTPIKTTP